MVVQIPIEYKNEFMLDILEVFCMDYELKILSDEEKIHIMNTLYFFGGTTKTDGINKAFIKFHTTEQ